jgi:hypothetical protein
MMADSSKMIATIATHKTTVASLKFAAAVKLINELDLLNHQKEEIKAHALLTSDKRA